MEEEVKIIEKVYNFNNDGEDIIVIFLSIFINVIINNFSNNFMMKIIIKITYKKGIYGGVNIKLKKSRRNIKTYIKRYTDIFKYDTNPTKFTLLST